MHFVRQLTSGQRLGKGSSGCPEFGHVPLFFFFFFKLFIYFWLCWVFVSVRGLSLVAASGGHSPSRRADLSLSRPLLLRSTGSRRAGSVIVAHGPSCSAAGGILPDQGSNPCPLHWQADSQPLRHQGSPGVSLLVGSWGTGGMVGPCLLLAVLLLPGTEGGSRAAARGAAPRTAASCGRPCCCPPGSGGEPLPGMRCLGQATLSHISLPLSSEAGPVATRGEFLHLPHAEQGHSQNLIK